MIFLLKIRSLIIYLIVEMSKYRFNIRQFTKLFLKDMTIISPNFKGFNYFLIFTKININHFY